MPWPIHVNRTVVIRKRIRASKSEVSKIVSDGESYLRLQPFVNEIAQDTSNPRQYRITERVPAPFGLWMFQNSFSVTFDPVEDQNGQGINMSANLDRSSLCPELKSMIRVKETEEPGVVEVVEIMELQVCCDISRLF